MKDTFKIVLCGAAACGVLGGPALAQEQNSNANSNIAANQPGSAQVLKPTDSKFLMDAAYTNMLEIRLGQLAQQRAQSNEVKSFADRMIKDHTDAQNSLSSVAQAAGTSLPTDLDAAGQKEYNKLSKLQGAQFDREYTKFNVPAHEKTLSDMKRAEQTISDQQLKSWDQKTLPTVAEHLKMAERTDRDVAAGKGKTTAGGSQHY